MTRPEHARMASIAEENEWSRLSAIAVMASASVLSTRLAAAKSVSMTLAELLSPLLLDPTLQGSFFTFWVCCRAAGPVNHAKSMPLL